MSGSVLQAGTHSEHGEGAEVVSGRDLWCWGTELTVSGIMCDSESSSHFGLSKMYYYIGKGVGKTVKDMFPDLSQYLSIFMINTI